MLRVATVLGAVVTSVVALAPQVPSPAPRAVLLNTDAPEFQLPAPDRALVRLETTRGTIDLEVTRDWAPRGADRFIALVRHGYYDDACFFRVVKERWAQFGINGDPAIAKAWRTRTFPDDPFRESNVHGTVAFAFAVPNGRTTQVFINLRDNSATHDTAAQPFTPFGRIIKGLDVADSLNAEYGDAAVGGIRAGRQDAFFNEGNALLRRDFPRLDYVRKAVIVQ